MSADFTVVSTPEQALQTFLKNVVNIESTLSQQSAVLSIKMPRDNEVALIMADGFVQNVFHIVGSDGSRVVATGYLSVINMLIGMGVNLGPNRAQATGIFHTRWAKAQRFYNRIPEDADVFGIEAWDAYAAAIGENAPSPITVAIIHQLAMEDM